jgi:urease accessory protein
VTRLCSREEVRLLRTDPGHYTTGELPKEFAGFDRPVDGLGVGQSGKVGLLELTLEPIAGLTRVVHHFQQFPLQVFRPVYLDPHRPDMAFLYVMSHGGALQGDRSRVDITCAHGAAAHVTTLSASKIYRMENNFATQRVSLIAQEDSLLEYMPDATIPFRGSRFHVETQLVFHETATMIVGEMLLPGRVAYGENHDYTLYASRLEGRSISGDLRFADALVFSSRTKPLDSAGQLGGHPVLATLYAVSRRMSPRALSDRLHDRTRHMADVVAGVSELPNECGVWVRLMGRTSAHVRQALHAAWDEARLALTGMPAPDRRKT